MGKRSKHKKTKIIVGAGIAILAVAAGLYVGKRIYDHRKSKRGHSFTSRNLVDDPLSPYYQPNPKTFINTSPIPDAVVLGLSYDETTNAKMNLIASCFDQCGNNVGYIQGGGNLTSQFDDAIKHQTNMTDASLDDENIVLDLRRLPENVTQILFGTYLIQPPSSSSSTPRLPNAYIHMLPLLRSEEVDNHIGSRGIEDEEDVKNDEDNSTEEDESEIRLYMDELDHTQFGTTRGFVGGKIFKDLTNGTWNLTLYRLPVNADDQVGVWPAFEHYARSESSSCSV